MVGDKMVDTYELKGSLLGVNNTLTIATFRDSMVPLSQTVEQTW